MFQHASSGQEGGFVILLVVGVRWHRLKKLVPQLSCQGESAALVSGQVHCLWEQTDEQADRPSPAAGLNGEGQDRAVCQMIRSIPVQKSHP